MPFFAARSIALRSWGVYGLQDVMSTETGFLIFRFDDEEGVQSVLERGPWMFGGKNIVIQQWHPHFSFDKNRISKVPVWARLHGVPFPLWTQKGLSMVSSMVGRPLSCDSMTYKHTRLSYARVCVEIDAKKPIVNRFEIQCRLSSEPIEVRVEYEWKPKRCQQCCLFGHVCQPTAPEKGKQVEEAEAVKILQRPQTTEIARTSQFNAVGLPVGNTVGLPTQGLKSVIVKADQREETDVTPLPTTGLKFASHVPVSFSDDEDTSDFNTSGRDTNLAKDLALVQDEFASGSESEPESVTPIEIDQDRFTGFCAQNSQDRLSSEDHSHSASPTVSDLKAVTSDQNKGIFEKPKNISTPQKGKGRGKGGKGSRTRR